MMWISLMYMCIFSFCCSIYLYNVSVKTVDFDCILYIYFLNSKWYSIVTYYAYHTVMIKTFPHWRHQTPCSLYYVRLSLWIWKKGWSVRWLKVLWGRCLISSSLSQMFQAQETTGKIFGFFVPDIFVYNLFSHEKIWLKTCITHI